MRLDSGQRSDGCVRLELDVHVLAQEGAGPDGQPDLLAGELAGHQRVDRQAAAHAGREPAGGGAPGAPIGALERAERKCPHDGDRKKPPG